MNIRLFLQCLVTALAGMACSEHGYNMFTATWWAVVLFVSLASHAMTKTK